jgi:hypothetical protein
VNGKRVAVDLDALDFAVAREGDYVAEVFVLARGRTRPEEGPDNSYYRNNDEQIYKSVTHPARTHIVS